MAIRISRQQLEEESRNVIAYLQHKLGPNVGLSIFVSEFGDNTNIAYISNIEREGMIATVKEWLARQEAGLTTDPLGPRGRG